MVVVDANLERPMRFNRLEGISNNGVGGDDDNNVRQVRGVPLRNQTITRLEGLRTAITTEEPHLTRLFGGFFIAIDIWSAGPLCSPGCRPVSNPG